MDEAYSTMTTPTRKRQRLNRLDNTKTFFRRRESQQDTIQDLFKPKHGDGEDAMEKVILKYTNVLPGQDSQMQIRQERERHQNAGNLSLDIFGSQRTGVKNRLLTGTGE